MEDQVNFCEEGNVEKLLNSEENLTISSNERESLKEEFSQEWLDVLGSGSLMLKVVLSNSESYNYYNQHKNFRL